MPSCFSFYFINKNNTCLYLRNSCFGYFSFNLKSNSTTRCPRNSKDRLIRGTTCFFGNTRNSRHVLRRACYVFDAWMQGYLHIGRSSSSREIDSNSQIHFKVSRSKTYRRLSHYTIDGYLSVCTPRQA